MVFKKDDENYIYTIISKNIKKYRKIKGWTQEKLANEINYSLSFIKGIESNCHQTFSLGAIWRISRVLGIEFSKLCEEESKENDTRKSIKFICNKCGLELDMPIKSIKLLKPIYENTNNNPITFDCTKCDGTLKPNNPLDIE